MGFELMPTPTKDKITFGVDIEVAQICVFHSAGKRVLEKKMVLRVTITTV